MGCNWVGIRNLSTTLGVLTGLASSSAVFAMEWHHNAPPGPWNDGVTSICYSAAGTWCTAALVTLGIEMSFAGTFCRCAARISACASACSGLMMALRAMLGLLIGLLALCIVASLDPEASGNPAMVIAIATAFALSAGGILVLGIATQKIIACQG